MANLTANDHNGYERAVLSDRSYIRRTNGTGQRILRIYTFAAAAVLAGLTYTAALVFEGWQDALVLGVGLITFYGICRWVWPERSRIY